MIPIDTLTTTLQIRMFGDFAIQYGDRVLTGNIGRSKKVWALIEYLLANRGKEISPDRMMERRQKNRGPGDAAGICV